VNKLTVIPNVEGAFSDLADRPFIHLGEGAEIAIGRLPGGMDSGRSSIVFRFELPDGQTVLAETSMRLFLGAAESLETVEAFAKSEEKIPSKDGWATRVIRRRPH
jgi:hypothetical protein